MSYVEVPGCATNVVNAALGLATGATAFLRQPNHVLD